MVFNEEGIIKWEKCGIAYKATIDELVAAYETIHGNCLFCQWATKYHDSEYCNDCIRHKNNKDKYQKIKRL